MSERHDPIFDDGLRCLGEVVFEIGQKVDPSGGPRARAFVVEACAMLLFGLLGSFSGTPEDSDEKILADVRELIERARRIEAAGRTVLS